MQPNCLTTAAFYGVPFVVLQSAREIAQKRHSARLIQPAPTLTNDARGLAGCFGNGVAADTQKNCND